VAFDHGPGANAHEFWLRLQTELMRGRQKHTRIYQVLRRNLGNELEGASTGSPFRGRLESVYTRSTEMCGEPLSLTDGYTFGQTLINDFGRPYERGFNSVTGFSAWTTAGPWVGYVRAEFQKKPFRTCLSESARITINRAIASPTPPPATPHIFS